MRILMPRVPVMSEPLESMGDAAPRRVPGVMAITWEAIAMKVPAEAARPPAGVT